MIYSRGWFTQFWPISVSIWVFSHFWTHVMETLFCRRQNILPASPGSSLLLAEVSGKFFVASGCTGAGSQSVPLKQQTGLASTTSALQTAQQLRDRITTVRGWAANYCNYEYFCCKANLQPDMSCQNYFILWVILILQYISRTSFSC